MTTLLAPPPSPLATPATASSSTCTRLRVTGVVQGVGFRPFVHRLAARHGLAGWVRNQSGEVEIALAGAPAAIDAFVAALVDDAPPLARIDAVTREAPSPADPAPGEGFAILASDDLAGHAQPVPADVATCDACAADIRDPANRRYRYPFTTCTDCGPRYTVIRALPYDRSRTSLSAFPQCAACQREYADPADRRHHSETNCCPACGPRVWYQAPHDPPVAPRSAWEAAARPNDTNVDAIACAAALLLRGGVLALRGVGGFHLAVDAANADAVALLRARKRRDAKPLALMVRTLAEAATIGEVSEAAASWLAARERPIVLLPRRAGAPIAGGVAPGLGEVGVMLAYSPLHHLLLDAVDRPLVMTSGNLSDEPIAAGLAEGLARLATLADGFLLHDREIVRRIDDSVVRIVDGDGVFLRRARGYAPLPLALPAATAPLPAILAVGAQMKGAFTLTDAGRAWVSPHLGDLDALETLRHFEATEAGYRQLFRAAPAVVAHDLHPDYGSTRIAAERAGDAVAPMRAIAVQHHHAHVAAVLGEHGRTDRVLGVAFDGTGFGPDGTIWGGELLLADAASFVRVARLAPAPLPGGEAAVRAPWRIALGYAHAAGDATPEASPLLDAVRDQLAPVALATAARQAARGINTPWHSSMGRLFDAAAVVLGVTAIARYEGQAAMQLEALAATARPGDGPLPALPLAARRAEDGLWTLDAAGLLLALAEARARGGDAARLALAFHQVIARRTAALAAGLAAEYEVDTVALGGGCFQNALLLAATRRELAARGLRVLAPRALPPNDGAISFGQAVVAAARLRARLSVSSPLPHP